MIASLNGVTPGGWVRYADLLQQAGADASSSTSTRSRPTCTRRRRASRTARCGSSARCTRRSRSRSRSRSGPYYTAFAHFAERLSEAGAAALVLFNRFLQPDIDLETLTVRPDLQLSTRDEMRLPSAVDRDPPGSCRCAARGDERRADDGRRAQAPARRRRRRDAGVAAPAPGPRPAHRADGRPHEWLTRQRVRVGRPAARQHEPGVVRQPARLRARAVRSRARRGGACPRAAGV